MSNKNILELLIKTSGLSMEKYELIRAGAMTGYQFEASRNGECQFQVATDSFEDAIRQTLEGIYDTTDVKFNAVL